MKDRQHCGRRHANLAVVFFAIVIVTGLMTGDVFAQDDINPQSAAAEETTPDVANGEPSPASDSVSPDGVSEEQRKQNVVSVLLMLLAGVGIVGVAMIGIAMIWGSHVRRLARQAEHRPTQQDDLWYMHRPPPEDAGPEGESGDADHSPPSPVGDLPTPEGETET